MPTITQGQIAKIFFNGYKGNLFAADQLAQDMKRLIDEAVAEAARLCAGQRPGFDFRRHPVMRQKLDEIIGRLRQQMESAIEQGSKDAWLRAETTTSKVVEAMAVGNPKLADILTAGLNVRQNDRALEAFQGRVINGMRLSDRVWNLTAQTQAQIEQGIEVALAEGVPSAKLSKEVRECLQNPDNFFRRFKYKVKDEPLFDDKGNPILDSTGKQATRPVYGRKWKRRYVDADGNTRWKDVNLDDYRYGRGVYRSAYKNAMRMARTEVNMAYQASDHERWKRSWWVKGIRVGLSNNHPVDDICNDLAGDYPADFKFVGWHPQCRCFAHAITATSEEIQDYYRRKRAGEDMSEYEVPGKIKEIPAGAKQWLSANQPRLLEAKANGTVPFFVSDNAKYTGAQFAPKTRPTAAKTDATTTQAEHVPLKAIPESAIKQQSIQERAAARHAARTEEDIERIQQAWNQRRAQRAAATHDVWSATDIPIRGGNVYKKKYAKELNSEFSELALDWGESDGGALCDFLRKSPWKNFDPVNLSRAIRERLRTFGISDIEGVFAADDLETLGLIWNGRGISINRQFMIDAKGRKVVEHDIFTLSKELQQKGIGKAVFQELYKEYRAAGVNMIHLCANKDVGGYAWAKYGFSTPIGTVEKYAEVNRDIYNMLKKFKTENPTAELFPMRLIAQERWGKGFLLGKRWEGVLDLNDKEAVSYLEWYIGIRK